MNWRNFWLSPWHSGPRRILLDCLKLEESTNTLFWKVTNHFPTDDALHPRKTNTWNKVVRINLPHIMKHVCNDIGSIKLASNLCYLVPTLYRDLPQRKISGTEKYGWMSILPWLTDCKVNRHLMFVFVLEKYCITAYHVPVILICDK
jgi:hypothetical protein